MKLKKPKRKTDRAFLDWITWHLCLSCHGFEKSVRSMVPEVPRVDPAHIKTRGAGGMDIGNVIPLCRAHHQEQHKIGVKTFGKKYGFDLKQMAEEYARLYKARNDKAPDTSEQSESDVW